MTARRNMRWLAVFACVFALVGAACGDDTEPTDGDTESPAQEFPAGSTMADLQEAGKITIGVKFDVPPFGFKNPTTDEVEGFDVDLGQAIADELGVEPEFIEAISDNRIPFLTDGTADLILSTMTITTDRDAEIDFSIPYYVAEGRVLVPEDSDITGVADLGGSTVCTATGSTYEENLKANAADAELRLVDTYSECLELIQTDSVDAVSTDDVILTGMIIQDETLKLVGDGYTTEPYGAGIADGDTEFKEFVDGVVSDYISDGRWAAAYENWIGQYTGEPQDPPTMTLEEALELRPCEETC
ncbi:MAG TPA: glutamate ABC transporter substrate-binding protein [Actinomycetota bacterium]|nr:glutamate ABC transporter substrate-binding protein [Actinomycetota bacterium]